MKIEEFKRVAALDEKSELERAALIAFYWAENKDQNEFDVSEVGTIFVALGYAHPNKTRLKEKIRKSKAFVKGSVEGRFRLSIKERSRLKAELPDISESEEILSDDSLLPEILLAETRRGYLIRIAQQINAAYEHNLFDACSLMMRRLLEILLIQSFDQCGIGAEALDADGNYAKLKVLINKAKSRPEIGLSPSTKSAIDDFRELGNLSAHRIAYNCRRDDIRPRRMEYRAVVEELLYKAGLKPNGS
ncbi:MAG: hypothetical protein ACO1PZ_01730 [Gammaproteobacteria bacterium]